MAERIGLVSKGRKIRSMSTHEPLLTLIVPVYNIARELPRCLCSIEKNDGSERTEIIFVDDGSSDTSMSILRNWVSKQPGRRCRILYQQNSGLSLARNKGLEHACGEYIWFIDGDDWISSNALSVIFSILDQQRVDILKFQRILSFPDGVRQRVQTVKAREISRDKKYHFKWYFESKIKSTVWDGVYRREIIGDIRFEPKKLHEDHFFTPRILARAKTLLVIEDCLYFYRQSRPGSIMSNYSLARLDILEATLMLRPLLKDLGLFSHFRSAYKQRVKRYILTSLLWSRSGSRLTIFCVPFMIAVRLLMTTLRINVRR